LEYIGTNRDEIYQGPDLEDLPGLTWQQKEAVAAFLSVEIKTETEQVEEEVVEENPPIEPEEDASNLPPTYSQEMTNQAVINAFYLMALELDINGQVLIASAGLEDLGETRNTVYTGPRIEDLPGLTWDIKLHLAGLLNVVIVLPNDEITVDTDLPEEQEPEPEQPETQVEVEAELEPEAEPEPEPLLTAEDEDVEQEDGVEQEIEDAAPEVDAEPEEELLEVPVVEEATLEEICEEPTEEDEEQFWFPVLTNQAVIEAFFQAAERLGREGWSLLEQAGLLDLDIDRAGRFAGLAAEKFEEIGEEVADLVVDALGLDNKKSLAKVVEDGEPYPGFVNLDIVNLFYKAAARAGENGQQWLNDSGMAYLNKSRVTRFRPYRGPEISHFLKLSREQRHALQAALEESTRENSLEMG
jgi:hypothetical protein